VLGHVRREELVADAPGHRQRGDDEEQAAVEARLPLARDRARRAAQVVDPERVEHPGDRRRKELKRREDDVHRRSA
jgi:hypothetical protein